MTLLQVLVCALLSTSVSASFSANLNYRSPSLNHPDLGIAVHKVQKRNDPACPFKAEDLKFTHGVASGDPYPESVILWTRVSPEDDNSHSNVTVSGLAPLYDHDNEKYVKISKAPVCVEYKVARDEGMKSVVDRGLAWTSSDVDYTVKVSADFVVAETSSLTPHPGRGFQLETLHHLLLPIQRLRFFLRQIPRWTYQDHTSQGRQGPQRCRNRSLLLLQLP
jgi:hypothetical protein